MEGKTDGTTRTSGVASCPSRGPLQFAQQLLQASNDLRRDIPASCWVQPHVTSYIILCLQHSTKPRRRQSLVPSTCFKRFVCAGGEHRTAWMAPPFRIFSMRSVAACQCSEPKKLACDNIWQYIVSICFCPCSTAATSLCHVPPGCLWNPWHSMAQIRPDLCNNGFHLDGSLMWQSLDWFCWENLHRKPWFLPLNLGVPVNFPNKPIQCDRNSTQICSEG